MTSGQGPGGGAPHARDKFESFEYQPGVTYNGFRVMCIKENISPLFLGDLIFKNFEEGIAIQIDKLGKNSAVVHCRDKKAANELCANLPMKEAGYKLFIPLYYVASCAIIFDIDPEYSEKDIFERMDARQFKPLKVERIQRRMFNSGSEEILDTRRMKVYFHGIDIPQHVFINYVRIRCEPFIQRLQQCRNCWRIGHWKSICKEEEIKCVICWGDHLAADCSSQNTPKCILCQGAHRSNDQACPERMRQLNIRVAMAAQNLCRNEAAMLFPRPRKNAYSFRQIIVSNSFQALDDEEFPPLPTHKPKSFNHIAEQIPAHQKPPKIAPPNQKTQNNKLPARHRVASRSRRNTEAEEDKLLQEAIKKAQEERKATDSQVIKSTLEQNSNNTSQLSTPKRNRDGGTSPPISRKISRSSSTSDSRGQHDLDDKVKKLLESTNATLNKFSAAPPVSQNQNFFHKPPDQQMETDKQQ